MATFDKVTYTEYSDVLGRSIVPTSDDFDALKLVNVQITKDLLPYIEEMEEDGIDKAVCLMIEKEYIYNQITSGKTEGIVTAESLGGHSQTFAERSKALELNAKSLDAQRMDCLKLFCRLNCGVR